MTVRDAIDLVRRDPREELQALVAPAPLYAPPATSAPVIEREKGVARMVLADDLTIEVQPRTGRTQVVSVMRKGACIFRNVVRLESKTSRRACLADLKDAGVEITETTLLALDDALREAPTRLPDDEPWPDPVDGAALADTLAVLLMRYVVLPPHAAPTMALWILHTYALDAADTSPVLLITSPEPRCGKTRLLTLIAALARRALPGSHITAASVFRVIERSQPTLFLDEADAYLRRGGHEDDDALRAIIDSGHTRATAFVIRCVGEDYEPQQFSTWAPKCLAMIGTPPATILDRAIVIPLRRRLASEWVESLRASRLERVCAPLRRQARRWADDHLAALRDADPDVPAALHDRAADNWRPLLAIADALGGEWPARAREAAVAIADADGGETETIRLLADLRRVVAGIEVDILSSGELLRRLLADEDAPWHEAAGGRPLTAAGLARRLRKHGLVPAQWRVGSRLVRGYRRDALEGVFRRYLPSEPVTVLHEPIFTRKTRDFNLQQPPPPTHPENADSSPKNGLLSHCHGLKGGEAPHPPCEPQPERSAPDSRSRPDGAPSSDLLAAAQRHPMVHALLAAFPEARIVSVEPLAEADHVQQPPLPLGDSGEVL